jgi:hypothetical protein
MRLPVRWNILLILLAFRAAAATTPRIVDYTPSTVSTSGGTTIVQYEGFTNPSVTIDGVQATIFDSATRTLTVAAPAHAAGAVQLSLRDTNSSATVTLHYADRVADWEGLLLPMMATNIPGAFGSLWNTETILLNENPEPVDLGQYSYNAHVAPQRTESFDAKWGGIPVIVWVPKWAIASLAISSRVVDTSRQALTWGTELPVVRVSQFARTITLINVPTDERFRATLRVYFPDSGAYPLRVTGRPMDRDEVLFDEEGRATAPHLAPYVPMSGVAAWTAISLDSLPNFHSAARLRLTISSPFSGWAMVSVTNNETQHVTLITPQPR